MKNITTWETSRVQLMGEQGDPTSISMSLYAFDEDSSYVIEVLDKPFVLVDGVKMADLSFTSPEVTEKRIYDYYVTENFTNEDPIIYPSPENCEGDCELPTITVCPLSTNEGS